MRALKRWHAYVLREEERLAREFDAHKWSEEGIYLRMRLGLREIQDRSRQRVWDGAPMYQLYRPQIWHSGTGLRFTSPVASRHPENQDVEANFFRARGRRAVLILGHWNSEASTYNELARHYQRFGIAALRLTLPYHGRRRPAHMPVARAMLSADLAQTITSIHQAVVEARVMVDWLSQQGYAQIGVVGSSLGSLVGLLTACHEPRVNFLLGYLPGADLPEVIWQGSATRHIRSELEQYLSLEELKAAWSCINPMEFLPLLKGRPFSAHAARARFDTICPPELTDRLLRELTRLEVPWTQSSYGCGHNTLGVFPFIYLAGPRGLYECWRGLGRANKV